MPEAHHGERPRCLLLDHDLTYVNPTRNLLPAILGLVCDLRIFGGGYVNPEVLAAGPEQFAERYGPFDLVVTTEHVLRPHLSDQMPPTAWGAHAYQHRRERMFSRTFFDFFRGFPGPRVLTLLESDYYNFSQRHIEVIDESKAYCLAWGPEFLKSVDGMEEAERFSKAANDNWRNFVYRRAERIISMPHFVAPEEFFWTALGERPFAWSVQGAGYSARRRVRAQLTEAGIAWRGRGIERTLGVLKRIGINPLNKYIGINLLNFSYRDNLRRARYAFACGSSLGYPVRKFFEIPAAGAVLVCIPCEGFGAMGFKQDENAVVCTPDRVVEVHRELEAERERAQGMADAGRRLVLEQHSVPARARQLGQVVEAICAGWFSGSRCQKGRFNLNRKRTVEHYATS